MPPAAASRAISSLLIPFLLATAPAVSHAAPVLRDNTPLTFDDKGAKVGEQLPNLTVYTLDGQPTEFSRSWGGVLVTSSLTCPKSRSKYPDALDIAVKTNTRVAILYVIEAHPNEDPSPYRGIIDVTPENQRDGILYRQPTSLEERLKLARAFRDKFQIPKEIEIYVDGMSNQAWRQVGGGPNMGLVIDRNGRVAARQGWFDANTLKPAAHEQAVVEAKADQRGETPHYRLIVEGSADLGFSEYTLSSPFRDGDTKAAETLLTKFPDLATLVDPFEARGHRGGRTMLHYAVEGSQPAMVALLAKRGADLNAQTAHVATPLHIAAKAGDLPTVEMLLKLGADVNRPATAGPMPLQEALLYAREDVVKRLTVAGAKPNIFASAALGDVAAVQRDLESDATIARRRDGWSRDLLDYAAAGGQAEVIKLLLSYGVSDKHRENSYEELALHWAARNGRAATVALLIDEATSDVDVRAGEGTATPLQLAIQARSAATVKTLLARHADTGKDDIYGDLAIHAAARAGNAEVIELLLASGGKGTSASEPTHANHFPCGPNDPTSDLETPLHLAARQSQPAAVETLLKHGGDANRLDARCQTPLHAAARPWQAGPAAADVVRKLLAAGANVNAKDTERKTPLDYAEEGAKAEKPTADAVAIRDLIKQAGGKPGHSVPGAPPAPPSQQPKVTGPGALDGLR